MPIEAISQVLSVSKAFAYALSAADAGASWFALETVPFECTKSMAVKAILGSCKLKMSESGHSVQSKSLGNIKSYLGVGPAGQRARACILS